MWFYFSISPTSDSSATRISAPPRWKNHCYSTHGNSTQRASAVLIFQQNRTTHSAIDNIGQIIYTNRKTVKAARNIVKQHSAYVRARVIVIPACLCVQWLVAVCWSEERAQTMLTNANGLFTIWCGLVAVLVLQQNDCRKYNYSFANSWVVGWAKLLSFNK